MTQEITYTCNGCGESDHTVDMPEKATGESTSLYLLPQWDELGDWRKVVRPTHCRNNDGIHFCEECGDRIRRYVLEDAIRQGEVERPAPKAEPAKEVG